LRTILPNNEAHDHLNSAVTAHEKGDAKGVASAHTRLSRCLRSVDVEHAKMAGGAMQADLDANHKLGTSAGLTEGTSSPPRSVHPLIAGDVVGWAARAVGKKAECLCNCIRLNVDILLTTRRHDRVKAEEPEPWTTRRLEFWPPH
jgi:hypothetical protein